MSNDTTFHEPIQKTVLKHYSKLLAGASSNTIPHSEEIEDAKQD
jgi:hypothetical protein